MCMVVYHNNIGTVPGDDKIRESVDDWMKDLNQFVQNELDDYESQPTWKELPDSETEEENVVVMD